MVYQRGQHRWGCYRRLTQTSWVVASQEQYLVCGSSRQDYEDMVPVWSKTARHPLENLRVSRFVWLYVFGHCWLRWTFGIPCWVFLACRWQFHVDEAELARIVLSCLIALDLLCDKGGAHASAWRSSRHLCHRVTPTWISTSPGRSSVSDTLSDTGLSTHMDKVLLRVVAQEVFFFCFAMLEAFATMLRRSSWHPRRDSQGARRLHGVNHLVGRDDNDCHWCCTRISRSTCDDDSLIHLGPDGVSTSMPVPGTRHLFAHRCGVCSVDQTVSILAPLPHLHVSPFSFSDNSTAFFVLHLGPTLIFVVTAFRSVRRGGSSPTSRRQIGEICQETFYEPLLFPPYCVEYCIVFSSSFVCLVHSRPSSRSFPSFRLGTAPSLVLLFDAIEKSRHAGGRRYLCSQ